MPLGRRGRPRTDDPKLPVTVIRLNERDRAVLETLAHNSGVSVYKYVYRIIHDRIDEYRDSILSKYESDYDYEESSYYVDEDGSYMEEDYQQ